MTRTVAVGRLPLFDFLIDFRNERLFGPTIRSCRIEKLSPGPRGGVGEGSEFRFDYRILGLPLSTRFRVEDVVAGSRFLLRSLRGGVPFTMGYVFEDEGDTACRLTVRTSLVDRTWVRVLRLLVEPAVRRDMNAYMDCLVKYAAATGLAPPESPPPSH
jgi:hypothetical protein